MAKFERKDEKDTTTFVLKGIWSIDAFDLLQPHLESMGSCASKKVVFDLSALETLDSSVAFLILKKAEKLKGQFSFVNQGQFESVLDVVGAFKKREDVLHFSKRDWIDRLAWIGERVLGVWASLCSLFAFVGQVILERIYLFKNPKAYKAKATFFHVARTGFDALPIVGLLTFLVGVVLAYQGAVQLAKFGAEIYTVNLLGISILREVGILLAAIIIAGRSGSAFTAQIGTMKVNQEVDALETIGLSPMHVLVVPRLDALFLTLPLLTFYGNICALLGGALTCRFALDIPFDSFVQQLRASAEINHFWVGMFKSPIFAFIIATVGCYEGLKVSGSAESVGLHTTRSVVKSIFIIIVLDALFSVMFAMMGV